MLENFKQRHAAKYHGRPWLFALCAGIQKSMSLRVLVALRQRERGSASTQERSCPENGFDRIAQIMLIRLSALAYNRRTELDRQRS
jgi:hypothetical protein